MAIIESVTEPHPGSSNSNSGYAFITHSQETLPLNLPPSIDNATLARRRRRRTSAHDQAILEEEYRKCDRPDKTKRKEITARVQMGEKEVQIWFQNKRQSTRRKSKPLLPHEIVPHNSQNSSQAISSSQQSSFESSQSSSSSQPQESNNYGTQSIRHCSASFSSLERRDSGMSGDCPSPQFPNTFSDDVSGSQGGGEYLGVSDADDEELDHSHQPSYQVAQSKRPTTGQTLGYNNNPSLESVISSSSCPEKGPTEHQQRKTSLAEADEHKVFAQVTMTTSAHNRLQDVLSSTPVNPRPSRRRTNPTTPKNPPRLLKRSSSIRLSTSLEGKASVVLEDEPSSPPAILALPTLKIQPSSISRSAPKRRTIDSKIWEFCCDNQAVIRSPCQPHEESSEATEALELVRKKGSSQKTLRDSTGNPLSIIEPKKSLRKVIPSSSPIKAKKSRKVISTKSSHPKPALRSNSGGSKKSRPPGLLLPEPGQDSDKENRPPGAPVSPPPEPRRITGVSGKGELLGSAKKNADKNKTPRKKNKKPSSLSPLLAAKDKRILEESRGIPTDSVGIFYDILSTSSQVYETEYDLPGGSQQTTFFDESSQESSAVPPGPVDEMECVENLLSLRGGTWR